MFVCFLAVEWQIAARARRFSRVIARCYHGNARTAATMRTREWVEYRMQMGRTEGWIRVRLQMGLECGLGLSLVLGWAN